MKPTPPPLKTSAPPGSKARRERAWGVFIANQLALPGFGTLLAGRKIGYAQLTLSVTGVACLTAFLIYAIPHLGELLRLSFQPADDPDVLIDRLREWKPWLLTAVSGILLWVIAWLWALKTSAQTLRDNRGSRAIPEGTKTEVP
jgi:hypothetical protein